jgi:hypothetical protein
VSSRSEESAEVVVAGDTARSRIGGEGPNEEVFEIRLVQALAARKVKGK